MIGLVHHVYYVPLKAQNTLF